VRGQGAGNIISIASGGGLIAAAAYCAKKFAARGISASLRLEEPCLRVTVLCPVTITTSRAGGLGGSSCRWPAGRWPGLMLGFAPKPESSSHLRVGGLAAGRVAGLFAGSCCLVGVGPGGGGDLVELLVGEPVPAVA
jgi:NAD(P)-dependent dehydrogenase (short-subunit alcohol dehydrogenase family)